MFDWDKIIIDVDDNAVDLTAGEVSLLVGADADTVTWGNINGDITQQPDLMLELDSKIGVDSPEFTGTPRTPTPPAGNSSTRIANTKFVNDTVNAAIPVGGFGALASKDTVNYDTEITNKPVLGALSSKSTVNYETEVTNKPTFGSLAYKSSVNYDTEVTNKPSLYDLSGTLQIESGGTGCNSEQELKDYIMSLIDPEQEDHKVRYYVDGDQGNDRTGDGSSENPFKTIQKAIDTASPFTETTINVLQGNFGEILTIEEKNIQITMVERQTPYYPGLWLIHNQTTRALDAAINVKNGTLRFYGNLRIDTIGDGIDIENGYVYLDGDPNTDAVRINNTRTDNSGKTAVAVSKRSVFVCADNIKLYAYFNEISGVQSNNIGISCHDWSYASVDSIQATYIGTLFFLYNSSLVYCGEATGSFVRRSLIQKSVFPAFDNLGTLAYKNSVNYETEIYNKPIIPETQEYAPDFNMYNNYKIGDYVRYGESLYRFILDHNAREWDPMDVTATHYSKELDTGEKVIVLSDSNSSSHVDDEIRKAGAHAITKVHLNYATSGSTTVSETVKTLVISGHKRITVRATGGNKITFNGLYGNTYHLQNKFYSIIVEDGAILELEGNISVTHSDSNGILVRRGGMVIYRSINGSVLNISLPSENYHDGILVESGGKFIADGNIVATRGSTIYQQYPSHVINVSYGAEAHVKGITATNFNYCIGCTGGLASYDSVSGAGVFTASGGRVFTGAQS